ncbi:MerR family transcriptional regulator [Bacillus kwashiorkori]|uniref:MerR family transcriptional regulator n=1 Tax=Bacillus kwashiorkori TaxID=1522318 RepID=UPI0007859229|nr:MerR family transcriptional regulator [Bacillus kwashiorkori]
MEYTVQQLAKLAGITGRTLRYYDEIGLLKPARVNSSGYRIYGEKEIDQLQQILFFRALEVDLDTIKKIMQSPEFDMITALKSHREELLTKRRQIDLLIENVEKTIAMKGGKVTMSNQEKFSGFTKQMIEENEKKFGKEIRSKYGNKTVDKSNEKLMGMTEEQYLVAKKLEEQVLETLNEAFVTGDPASEIAQKAADLHRQWLSFYWSQYTKEAHAGVAQMYVADERFSAYYEREHKGAAKFLHDAIMIYTGVDK